MTVEGELSRGDGHRYRRAGAGFQNDNNSLQMQSNSYTHRVSFPGSRFTRKIPTQQSSRSTVSIPLHHLPPRSQHHLLPPSLQPFRSSRLITSPLHPLLLLTLHSLLSLPSHSTLQPVPRNQVRLLTPAPSRRSHRSRRIARSRRHRQRRLIARRRIVQRAPSQYALRCRGDAAAVAVEVPSYGALI